MVKKLEQLNQSDRKISAKKIGLVFAMTVLIFSVGLLVGYAITSAKISDIANFERESRFQLESLDLEEKLLNEVPCVDSGALTDKLSDLGARLTYLESQYDKNDPRVIELKKPYTLLQARHYLRLRDMKESCGQDYSIVLFFYSNSAENIKLSEEQGFVLDYLKKKFSSDKVKTYSFDADLDIEIIDSLKRVYGVTSTPSTVIDGKLFVGFHGKEELEKVFEETIRNN